MAIRKIPVSAPPPARLGAVRLQDVFGGLSLQTAMLIAFAAFLVFRMFFSGAAKGRRDELGKARGRYDADVRRIKARYR